MDCLNRVSDLDSDFYGLGRLYLDGCCHADSKGNEVYNRYYNKIIRYR